MTAQFARGPQPRATSQPHNAPHAALLIDFDNVTMGIRSDLTKELKNLLNSDIIKGKVAVQRAYADWRRYPQYIVPLAENSVDLIFAPAYGSSKKNATDIRLAIDALELVFTRAEIGTFILLSGDSDFSSLVLKLKEYGKYVIGVGIRESSSDLLVQNCDEYYSYSALTGLTRAGDEEPRQSYDPWELVEIAVRQMVTNRDVMRSDRLKQILLELDPNFDEKALGFTKFNRFLQEAANKGMLHLRKMENGQFEVGPAEPGVEPAALPAPEPAARSRRGAPRAQPAEPRRDEPRLEDRKPDEVKAEERKPEEKRPEPVLAKAPPPPAEAQKPVETGAPGELRSAFELLQRATTDLSRGKGVVRDSDVKRRMLELRPGFDEGAYGFSKFSRFLRQAHDAEVINLNKVENGSYEVTLGIQANSYRSAEPTDAGAIPARGRGRDRDRGRGRDRDRDRQNDRHAPSAEAKPEEPRWDPAPETVKPWETAKTSEAVKTSETTKTPETVKTTDAVKTPESVKTPEAGKQSDARTKNEPRMFAPVAAQKSEPVSARPPVVENRQTATPAPSAGAVKPAVSLGFRRGSRGGHAPAGPPPILEGQGIKPISVTASAAPQPEPTGSTAETQRKERPKRERPERPVRRAPAVEPVSDGTPLPFEQLALPSAESEVVERLAGYKGVGRKSAEATVQAFGPDVFRVLHEQPERVRQMLGGRRAEQLLKGWLQDYTELSGAGAAKNAGKKTPAKPAGGRGGARKSARKKAGSASK